MLKDFKYSKYSFYIFFAFISLLFLFLIHNYFNVIFFSIVLSIVLSPLYTLIDKIPKINKYISSVLTLLAVFLISILPLYYLFISIYVEVVNFRNLISAYSLDQLLYTIVDNVNNYLKASMLGDTYLLNFYDTKTYLNQLINLIYNRLFGFALTVSQTSLSFFVKILIMCFLTIYLMPNLQKFQNFIIKYSQLNEEHSKLFIKKFRDFVNAFIQGVIPVAVIQGSSAGIILLILGVPNSLLLTFLMIFLSIIPFLGSGLTMFVIATVLFINGEITKAFIILVWNILVVTNIDNVFRTLFISKRTKLNPVLMFFSIMLGLQVFGIVGLFYGPLIVIFFITCFQLYNEHYKKI